MSDYKSVDRHSFLDAVEFLDKNFTRCSDLNYIDKYWCWSWYNEKDKIVVAYCEGCIDEDSNFVDGEYFIKEHLLVD